jgi:hypothetical protein
MLVVEVALFLYIISTTKVMNVVILSSEAWVTGTKVVRAAFAGVLKIEPVDFQVEGTYNVALK